jgi:hypothetical protein
MAMLLLKGAHDAQERLTRRLGCRTAQTNPSTNRLFFSTAESGLELVHHHFFSTALKNPNISWVGRFDWIARASTALHRGASYRTSEHDCHEKSGLDNHALRRKSLLALT